MTMTRKQQLLIEVAGLLTLLVHGIPVPNLREQAEDLLNKIGDVLVEEGKPTT